MKKTSPKRLVSFALAAVIMAYAALAVSMSYATRLRYGPDEPAHFVYVREIATRFRMPVLSHEITPDISTRSSHEAHQPPLYYLLMAVPYSIANSLGASTNTIWRILRLFTIIFGAGWIYFLYRLSAEFLGGNRFAAVLAAACVGLLPSAVYIGGVVNNDALGMMTFTAALWLIFKSLRRGNISRKAAIEIGLVCGLAVLAKAQGFLLLPVAAMAGAMIAGRRGWRASASIIGNAALALLVAIAISSVWLVRNSLIFGSPMIQSLYNPGPGWSVYAIIAVTVQLFRFFWTPYWLVSVFVNDILYMRLLAAFCFLVFVGIVIHLRSKRYTVGDSLDRRLDAWILLALPGFLIYVFLVRHTLLVDKGALQQGRLLLPAAGIWGIAVVTSLGKLVSRPALRTVGGVLLAFGLVLANIAVINAIAMFYRMH